jgi:hypothetical protein
MPCGELGRSGLVDQIDDFQIKGVKDAGALVGTHGYVLHKNFGPSFISPVLSVKIVIVRRKSACCNAKEAAGALASAGALLLSLAQSE